jgi:5-methylcytosine-specific restriction endonuclease McrA
MECAVDEVSNTKICNACKQEKPSIDFAFRKDQQRFRSTCRKCKSEHNKKRKKILPDPGLMFKACRNCGAEKPLHDFHFNGRSRDGYSAACKECAIGVSRKWREENAEHSEIQRATYREANREKLRLNAKEYRKKNPEAAARGIAALRQWTIDNPDKAKESVRKAGERFKERYPDRIKTAQHKTRQKNKVKIAERFKEYRANNRELYRESTKRWCRNNPEKKKALDARRKARERDAEGFFTGEDLARIRIAQRDRCGCCKAKLNGKGEADHIIALANGGNNWPSNIQLLCSPCNNRKRAKDPITFMQEMGYLL